MSTAMEAKHSFLAVPGNEHCPEGRATSKDSACAPNNTESIRTSASAGVKLASLAKSLREDVQKDGDYLWDDEDPEPEEYLEPPERAVALSPRDFSDVGTDSETEDDYVKPERAVGRRPCDFSTTDDFSDVGTDSEAEDDYVKPERAVARRPCDFSASDDDESEAEDGHTALERAMSLRPNDFSHSEDDVEKNMQNLQQSAVSKGVAVG